MMKINCLIVDDEPVARKGLVEYVAGVDFLNLVAACENAMKAAEHLEGQAVDLVFLDIHMPELSGVEFVKTLKHPPLIVFTTAYPEYALEGYALDVVDYLMKPVTFDRFLKAAQKAQEIHSLRRKHLHTDGGGVTADYFFVKCNGKFEKVFFSEVSHVEAMQNYAVIHAGKRRLITYITMSSLEAQLPPAQFMKVHKSYIVSLAHVTAIEGNEIVAGNTHIPVSRNLKEAVMARILGDKLFKR
jgi:DNA-binding LytR/AlgR family response regulator